MRYALIGLVLFLSQSVAGQTVTEGQWKAATKTIELSRSEYQKWWQLEVSTKKPVQSKIELDGYKADCSVNRENHPTSLRRDRFDYRLVVDADEVSTDRLRVRVEVWIHRFLTLPPQTEEDWRQIQTKCLRTLLNRLFEYVQPNATAP